MEVTESSVLMLPFAASSVGAARRRLVSDMIAAGICDSAVCDVALVFSELLSNALRHADPLSGGNIEVSWRLDADCVQVSVRDGGGETRRDRGPGPADRREAVQGLGNQPWRRGHHCVGAGADQPGAAAAGVGRRPRGGGRERVGERVGLRTAGGNGVAISRGG
jgi:anti-sigma regulatory factor (Ser/Thr protein kinase)